MGRLDFVAQCISAIETEKESKKQLIEILELKGVDKDVIRYVTEAEDRALMYLEMYKKLVEIVMA